jgi:hypothetical protein
VEDRTARLESRLTALAEHVKSLDHRIEQLESQGPGVPVAASDVQPTTHTLLAAAELPSGAMQQWLGLVGRTLMILGGAYLLRALTDSHVLPSQVGVGLGLLYGAPWLFLASRAGARGAHLDAFTHALTTALIGYPLVWEATLRFKVLTPAQSAVLLAALTTGALVLAFMRHLQGLAWVVTFGALASAAGLAMATGSWTPYTILAIAVGVGTLWLGYVREWTGLRWPAAAVANLMMFVVTGRTVAGGGGRTALLVQLLMLAAYLGSFAVRTLFIGRQVIPFEVVQSVGVLAVAFGGAIFVIQSSGTNVVPVGVATLMLAAAGYVVAFAFVERHRHVSTFLFYGLLALLFAMVGIGLCAGAVADSIGYSAVAVAAAILARRTRRLTLNVHAIIYATGAAAASGLLTTATLAVLLPSTAGWGAPTGAASVALAALLVVTSLRVRDPIEQWGVFASIPRLAIVSMLTWAGVGASVAVTAPLLVGGTNADLSLLATVRTGFLVAATLILARCSRMPGGREAGWLVYPLVLVTGLKLLFVDFPQGRPATLFAALALYGAALIVAPRMLRRTDASTPAVPQPRSS